MCVCDEGYYLKDLYNTDPCVTRPCSSCETCDASCKTCSNPDATSKPYIAIN